MSLLYSWLAIGLIFIIVEVATSTFYGLSIALSAFAVALYVYLMGSSSVDIAQGLIFVGVSAILAYALPTWLTPAGGVTPQGLDSYIGMTRKIKVSGDIWHVTLDGIKYPIEIATPAQTGDSVRITARQGSVFMGEVI